jgi:hypothetical protein
MAKNSGQFKPGEHWRDPKPFWQRDWLVTEYVEKGRSSGDIAREWGVTDTAIFFWLQKHGIPRRTISEARALKKWALSGAANGMHGRNGSQNPNWKGGISPDRQGFYSSAEWKRAARFVRSRDKGICQRCGIDARGSAALHHIIPFASVEHRTDPDNLVTLCKACHAFVHSRINVNREFIGKEV